MLDQKTLAFCWRFFFGHWKITTRESKPNNNDAMFADYDVGSLHDLVAMFFNVSSQNFYSA